ncbi:biliverdin-producing heme oxygenase [Mangrovibrevibacter kandeliae]|uniref:biliverdin-producing heme oxygenase n=1 Tax=Mangrovibrevibacter kandeliae TaxID=2968473 RepID=UPI00355713E8
MMNESTQNGFGEPAVESRAKRLKAATHATHERLDSRMMAADSFASRTAYVSYLAVQYQFHCEIAALYVDERLAAIIPDLGRRRRLELIEKDYDDLGHALPEPAGHVLSPADRPVALGWLYVAEGSNLGAAFLLKGAAALGLSEAHGARHLAAAPEGRGLQWRSFTTALDAVILDAADEKRVIKGAHAAFARVLELATIHLNRSHNS